MQILVFLSLFLISFIFPADFLYLWEPRTLQCLSKGCKLSKNADQTGLSPANCSFSGNSAENVFVECDIECDGAERDSVISKKPTVYRYCNRFFTYNTRKTSDGKWTVWRNGTCANANITMTVHCAFPL
ncbi:Protein CBG18576 [Caenorhabditis briggsae]|uniref:Protein CBG18576 n=2 Tax=Caenorhabditis briggsae TaxID=6238 RepID=A8XTM2_CAEBR|nr:Protein CBG18576 [Caenorhabditis briggsae]ULT92272.1 hypothetical protein L3Y34_009789 [Caenorhabditis briggsae]CAP35998.1 Protein CBG18576 [Caenorhabditis briggsae]